MAMQTLAANPFPQKLVGLPHRPRPCRRSHPAATKMRSVRLSKSTAQRKIFDKTSFGLLPRELAKAWFFDMSNCEPNGIPEGLKHSDNPWLPTMCASPPRATYRLQPRSDPK